METRERHITEFHSLCEKYTRANERMLVLQATAIEGMRKIGTGCLTENAQTEFVTLSNEIATVLTRMQEICELLHHS